MSSDTALADQQSTDDPFPGQDYGVVPPGAKVTNMLDSVREAVNQGKDAVGDAADKLSSKAAEVATSAHEHATELTQAAAEQTTAVRSSASDFFRDNPLAVGIFAFLIGAAIGIAIPRTDAENEIMGGARQKLMQKAKGAVDDLKESAEQVASDVVDSVKDQVKASSS